MEGLKLMVIKAKKHICFVAAVISFLHKLDHSINNHFTELSCLIIMGHTVCRYYDSCVYV